MDLTQCLTEHMEALQLQEYEYADFLPFTEADIAIKNISRRKGQYHCKDNFIRLHIWHPVSSDKFRLGGDIAI